MEQTRIKKVEVIPGCISCRNCENVCPDIFRVSPTSEIISHEYDGKEVEILQAEALCPVQVIKVKKTGSVKLRFQDGTILSKKMLTPNVLELRIATKDFRSHPGQYVSIRMKDKYGNFSRSYSLADFSENAFTLTVKLLPKGRGSRFLEKVAVGKKISFLGGIGMFTLQDTPRRIVCIATGTGLAPMMSILKNAPHDREKIVIFGVRHSEDWYYRAELAKIPNCRVVYVVSRPKSDEILPDGALTGYVTAHLDLVTDQDEIYLCGNPLMINDVRTALSEKNIPDKQIHHESFTTTGGYPGFWRYHVMEGNVPYKNLISWIVILFALTVPFTWLYHVKNGTLYGPFLGVDNYMGFLYDLSWYAVVFVMGIRPLSDIFPNVKIFRSLCDFRKPFGILSAMIIVTNWLGGFVLRPEKILPYFHPSMWAWGPGLTSRLSEWTGLLLLLTSNSFSQKRL